MPLIRLISHPYRNKFLGDKMIFVEGIPEHLMYFKRNGKNFLKEPWMVDVSENIPESVKAKFQPEPFIVNRHQSSPEKGIPPLDDELPVHGLMLDCQNGQGEEMWKKIERMIDDITPRGEDLPEPILIVPSLDDEHRNLPFGIEAIEILRVDLKTKKVELVRAEREAPPVQSNKVFSCPDCPKAFPKEQGLRMHKMKARHGQVAVGV